MTKDKKPELKIKAIENGTVIDHITANKALHILKILDLPDAETRNVTVAMNVSSAEIGRKDIVKIENRELNGSKKTRLYFPIKSHLSLSAPIQNALQIMKMNRLLQFLM